MIRRIVVFSIRNRFLLIGVVFLLALAGLLVFPLLPRGLLPRLDVPTLNVFVENPALSADEIETLVIRPLEGRLRGLLGAQTVRSSAQQGLGQVSVTFDWSTGLQDATQRVTTAVGQAQTAFPAGTLPPTIGNPSSSINQVLQYYLEAKPGSGVSLRDLRTAADATVAPAVQAIPGVLRVLDVGGEVRTFEVAADPRRLAAYDLSLADLARAIGDANAPFSGSIVPEGAREVLVRPSGRLRSIDDLREVVVGEREGRAVRLPQVAEVREGSLLRRSIAMAEGREVVGGTVITQFGADAGPIIARAKEVLRGVRPALPPGVVIRTYFDETELVDAAIGSLRDALLVGAVAVVLVIFLLLWDWVTTLLIAIVLPVVVSITFLAMRLFGVGVDVMSLGGIAVALGIMVDSAIVDAENIFRRLQQDSENAFETTVEGVLEVRRPITYAMLIIVAAFVPVFFLPGIAGRIFQPFGFTVIAAMFVGYAISMTLTPALCYTFLPRRVSRGVRESPLLRPVRRLFEPALVRVVAHPPAALAAGAILALSTFLLVPLLGSEFLPSWDEGLLMVKAQTPPGTGVAETARLAERVSEVIHRGPDVAQAFFWAGRPEASEEPEGANNSEITVTLVPFKRRTESVDEIKDWLREHVGEAPGTRILFTSPMTERLEESLGSGSGGGGPLVAQIFGDDLDVLSDRLERLAVLIRSVTGVAEVQEEQTVGLPQLEVRVDAVAAARFGLTRADVGQAVELAMGGQTVTSVFPGARQEIPIVVRVNESYRNDPDRIGDLLLATPGGGRVPLREVASLVRGEGPHQIARENAQRRVQLGATLTGGRDLGSVVNEIERRAGELDLPRGYRLEFAGSYRSQQQVQNTVVLAFGLSLLFVYIVLYLAFDSGRQAALVLFSIPLALLGGFTALWLTGTTLNVSSLIGILAHLGLSVQKAVILVEYANDRMAEGMDPHRAAVEAGHVRMRPVLMTALAASLAVVPLVLGLGAGAELQRPLAIVLIGGLLTSTPLVLFLLPALYPWTVGRRDGAAVASA